MIQVHVPVMGVEVRLLSRASNTVSGLCFFIGKTVFAGRWQLVLLVFRVSSLHLSCHFFGRHFVEPIEVVIIYLSV